MSKGKAYFTLNTKIFLADLLRFAKANEDEAKKGLAEGFWMMIDDAKWKPPQAPFLKGDLHGSAELDSIKITKNYIEVSGGFNIEYAGRLHEMESYEKPTRTVVRAPGPKFLESKMTQFGNDYIEPAVKRMKTLYGGK